MVGINEKKTNGLTLLELVVALTISVLLVGATAGVLKSMAKKKEVFAEKATFQPWHLELSRSIRSDLLHATRLRIRPDGFSMIGPCGHDRQTREFLQKSAIVDWRIVRKGNKSVLLRREQTDELVIGPDTVQTEFFGVGIESISVGAFTGEEFAGGAHASFSAIAPEEWTPVAPALRFVVRGENNCLLLDEVFYR